MDFGPRKNPHARQERLSLQPMKKLVSMLIRHIPRKYLQRISGPGLRLAGFFLRGSQVFCPVCDRGFRKFLPYGRINPRANALCPNCLSLERHRLIWLYLQETTDFFKSRRPVLHIAPEACFIPRFERIHGGPVHHRRPGIPAGQGKNGHPPDALRG